jgi:hypothetical protein
MTAAWARPGRGGDVELSVALRKIGDAPLSLEVGGRRLPLAKWVANEIVEHRVRLDLPDGKSRVAVGSATLEVEAHPFSGDFESGVAVGWTGAVSVRKGPRWGIEGNFYAFGAMQSAPLLGGIDEICFSGAEAGLAALQVDGRRLAQETGRHDDIFRPTCFASPPPGARLLTSGMAIDDIECTAGGRPTPCAGQAEAKGK